MKTNILLALLQFTNKQLTKEKLNEQLAIFAAENQREYNNLEEIKKFSIKNKNCFKTIIDDYSFFTNGIIGFLSTSLNLKDLSINEKELAKQQIDKIFDTSKRKIIDFNIKAFLNVARLFAINDIFTFQVADEIFTIDTKIIDNACKISNFKFCKAYFKENKAPIIFEQGSEKLAICCIANCGHSPSIEILEDGSFSIIVLDKKEEITKETVQEKEEKIDVINIIQEEKITEKQKKYLAYLLKKDIEEFSTLTKKQATKMISKIKWEKRASHLVA